MRYILIPVILIVIMIPSESSAGEDWRVSVYINPLKPFLGLLNLGVEFQFDRQYSFYLSGEYAVFRSGYMEKLNHPDLVGTLGVRHYFSPDDPDVSGGFAGLSCGYLSYKAVDDISASRDYFIGAEYGYRFLFDNSTFISPRVLISVPLRGMKLLPGAEAAFGKIL